MLQQWDAIKKTLSPDVILLFKLGDFYEAFEEDAKIVAKTLTIALTKRGTVPMAGIPYHCLDKWVKMLVKAGYKVAVCEQLSAPGKPAPDPSKLQIISEGSDT